MAYAAATRVPEDRSRNEIEQLVRRYGATNFAYANGATGAMVAFETKRRRVRFLLAYPPEMRKPAEHRGRWDAAEAMAQERRRLWRALVLVVKAKLEGVASKVETFDQAFMAHLVMPGGRTLAEHLMPEVERMITSGKMGPLLLEERTASSSSGGE